METNQMKEVIEFLAAGNPEQKQGAMDIILPYTGTAETRALFKDTEIAKELCRQLPVLTS